MAFRGISGVADMIAVLPPPLLDGRLLDPVGLQTFRSRTRIGLQLFLPSAMIALPLNSLPLRRSVCPKVNYREEAHDDIQSLAEDVSQ